MRAKRWKGAGEGRPDSFRGRAGLWIACMVAWASLAAAPAEALVVTKADDVCAPADDPCLVTSEMEIPDGLCTNDADQPCSTNSDCVLPGFCTVGSVVLDFGVRAVEVSGSGQFDFGTSSGSILCGDFESTHISTTIDANGNSEGGSRGGTVTVVARRLCSAGSEAYPCVFDSDCQLGTCGTRRCSLGEHRACLADLDCSIGPCIQKGLDTVCSGQESQLCQTNADCELGTCPVQTTCASVDGGVVDCSTDDDCDFGTCAVGTASVLVGGAISGFAAFPAVIQLRASDDIVTEMPVHIDGTVGPSDGGKFDARTAFGSITVNGDIDASSEQLGKGGEVLLHAGSDVVVANIVRVNGGDLDGGTVDIDAGRDVVLGRSLLGNSTSGAGSGGAFVVSAGRDLTVVGAGIGNETLLSTRGHANLANEGGNGGVQDLSAGRDLAVDVNSRMVSNATALDALGGSILLTASANLSLDGDVVARGNGAQGGGGTLSVISGGELVVASTSSVDLEGSERGGSIVLEAAGNIDLAGKVELGRNDSEDGVYGQVASDADVTISGSIRMNKSEYGTLDIEACRIALTSSGSLDAGLGQGRNVLVAHESMTLAGGSVVKTGATGENSLIYRAASKPPVINGTVTPTAIQTVDADLSPCPVCGNDELDGGESCEDGNTVDGDGCSSDCQNENCVEQTAPEVACDTNADCDPTRTCSEDTGFCTPWLLCEDGDLCTVDTCNMAVGGGTCQHLPRDCDDGFGCTTDSCDSLSGACAHEADDGACDDGNLCTDDVCTLNSGCAGVSNSEPCDDGDPCTENDSCSASECSGTPINGCSVCGDGVWSEASEPCDDGNSTFVDGEYCGVDCVLIPCGKPTNSAGELPLASDSQFTLKAAVGQVACCLRVCDVDNTGTILASDAQRILRKAVGQDVAMNCPTTGGCPP